MQKGYGLLTVTGIKGRDSRNKGSLNAPYNDQLTNACKTSDSVIIDTPMKCPIQ